jgi:hypothetical protein
MTPPPNDAGMAARAAEFIRVVSSISNPGLGGSAGKTAAGAVGSFAELTQMINDRLSCASAFYQLIIRKVVDERQHAAQKRRRPRPWGTVSASFSTGRRCLGSAATARADHPEPALRWAAALA